MIYRKLRKLEQHKRDLQSLIIAAYASGADPEVIMIRVSDLQYDLSKLDHEIQMEEIFVRLKLGLAIFLFGAVSIIIYGLINHL
jgi:hypothetical protein